MIDNYLLDILFDCNGIDLVIKSIEKAIEDLSRVRQGKIRNDLLILRVYLSDIRKTIDKLHPENFPDEIIVKHSEDKSKRIVHDVKTLVQTNITIKPLIK